MRRDERPIVAGIGVSHPDRVVFPDLGLSKLDLATYFASIGDWIGRTIPARWLAPFAYP